MSWIKAIRQQQAMSVFQAVLAAGTAARTWATLRDLDLAAGVHVKPDRADDTDAQPVTLF